MANSSWLGACLCEAVTFEISAPLSDIYQCHCSKCRKVSGSASNSAMVIEKERFRWLSGEHDIKQFQQKSGFKSHFCHHCGSPVPNPTGTNKMWIPMGLVDGRVPARISEQVYLDSKADWDC